jgi:hypothetical protein
MAGSFFFCGRWKLKKLVTREPTLSLKAGALDLLGINSSE